MREDIFVRGRAAVLIIDDDRQFTALVEAHLAAAGYSSAVAHDPVQGFIMARRDRPRLILLDIAMPAGGGLPLLKRLVRTGPTKHIPVIVVTVLQEPELEIEARAGGALGFLRKPIERETLLANVKAALNPG